MIFKLPIKSTLLLSFIGVGYISHPSWAIEEILDYKPTLDCTFRPDMRDYSFSKTYLKVIKDGQVSIEDTQKEVSITILVEGGLITFGKLVYRPTTNPENATVVTSGPSSAGPAIGKPGQHTLHAEIKSAQVSARFDCHLHESFPWRRVPSTIQPELAEQHSQSNR